MSYVQIEIGGKLRGLKFNNYGIEQMLLKLGDREVKDDKADATDDKPGASDVESIYAMFWGGLRGNSYAKEEKPDYTFGEVVDWVDELTANDDGEKVAQVLKVMQESQLYKKFVTKAEKKSEAEILSETSSIPTLLPSGS